MPQGGQPRAAPQATARAQPSPQAPPDPQTLKKQAPLLYAELTGQPPAVVIVPDTFAHKDLRKKYRMKDVIVSEANLSTPGLYMHSVLGEIKDPMSIVQLGKGSDPGVEGPSSEDEQHKFELVNF
ncbi:hypothetical protein CAEBREN_00587 [Caenorhabditis brenneri]|uniref:Uncharacterized protein n=1 Tax=Caenorhabditis brenneri TaxID=135651 RepID=G0PG69_CAEBE|nr:hypothetical protein CAEBREN_00587 [Caenorhabditis brenneri]